MNQKTNAVLERLDRLRDAAPKLNDFELDRLAAFIDGLTFRLGKDGQDKGKRKGKN